MAAAAAAAAAFLFLPKATPKSFLPAVKFRISLSTPHLCVYPLPCPAPPAAAAAAAAAALGTQRSSLFRPCSAVQEIAVEEETVGAEEVIEDEAEKKSKLFVANLPWTCSAPDIETLFGECGTVKNVEIRKQRNGRSRGSAFITMDSEEAALAAIEKFDSYELLGRIIRVESAKSSRKPSPPPVPVETVVETRPAPVETVVETRHKIYVSNLAWKVRSVNLRNFFSAKFKPVSARVVFDSPSGKSAGYGFVSFATKEEAEAALSELDGKELMNRPLRLRIAQKKGDEAGTKPEIVDNTEGVEGRSEEI